MANEIITNVEDIEEFENVETSKSGSGWLIAGGAALLAALGFGAYKAGKWAKGKIADRKAKKAAEKCDADTADVESV